MGSFKDVQNMLTLCLEKEIIDDEEFILLYEEYMPQNPPFPHSWYETFSLVNKDPAECKADFRVQKRDIPQLDEALRIPPISKCVNGMICDRTEGLCIVLKRFAYPCRFSDMIPIFGRSVSEPSIITNEVIDWMYTEHGHRVSNPNHGILSPALLRTYADSISDNCFDNCFGFIDGTVQSITRPIVNQRMVYNGHKRCEYMH